MMRMMKLILCFLLIASLNANAKELISSKSLTFTPIEWHLTLMSGGFVIQNETSRNEYVQINVTSGTVTVFKRNHGEERCYANLGGDSTVHSSICELFPGENLYVDLDYFPMNDARGTYQIIME